MYKDYFNRPAFNPSQLFMGGYAGFLGQPLVTDANDVVGTAIGTQYNQAPAAAFNLTQSSGSAKPTLGRIPVGGRRNQFLNTATLSTQNVTTRAVAYTLSFKGTGSITLTGTSTAGPLVGTGANDRVSLTFTPTAGTLTCTVAGSVTEAQIQFGSAFDAYQAVGAAYDVTEEGVRSILMPYYDGGDWLTGGVQSFGTASLFAAAGQQWSVGGVYNTFVQSPSVLAKCGATEVDRTFQIGVASTNTGFLWIRGTQTFAIPLADPGLLNVWLLVWDGAALTLYMNTAAGTSVSVGGDAEESQNILVGARTESLPAGFVTGFNDVTLMIDRALTAPEIASWRAAANSYYRGA